MRLQVSAALLSLLSCSLVGCSSAGSTLSSTGSTEPEVASATVRRFDENLARRSELYHEYLMSQLSYDDERIAEAARHLERVNSLLEDPAPDVLIQLTQLYLRLGELEEARSVIERVVSGRPEDVDAQLLHAGILAAVGEGSEAYKIYVELIGRAPGRLEPYLYAAEQAHRAGKLTDANRIVADAVVHFPKESLVLSTQGRIFELQGNDSEAAHSYQRAYQLEKATPQALDLIRALLKRGATLEAMTLGREIAAAEPATLFLRRFVETYLSSSDQTDAALSELEKYADLQEQNLPLRMKVALVLLQSQNVEGALRELLLLLAQDPKHAQARYQFATLLASRGRTKEAVEELLRIDAESDMFVKSRTFAAFIARQNGDFDTAEGAVREALAREEGDAQLQSYLILLLRDGKKYTEALQLIEQALTKDARNERLLFNYALVLHDLGRADEAVTAMEKVLVSNPGNSDALNFVAYTLVERNDPALYPRALALIEKAIALRPDDAYYLDTFGWILFKLGRLDEAATALSRSVQASSEDLVIVEHYGQVLLKLGRKREARELFQRALERSSEGEDAEQNEARAEIEALLNQLQ